ncbi:MAG: radical SAM protein [Candidatus Omnitrophica bacterium]|nr:radical SAM protein [Candidatus Omnitrophota bacterium]
MNNKKINKIKLTLTTKCDSSCQYCFVKKTNERMSYIIAKKSIDLLINARGKNKLLALYGGEPFLEFDLIKKIVPYAEKLARGKKKNLTVSICTNLTILSKKHIHFIKENNIKITVSLVGTPKLHNKYRLFRNKNKTYEKVLQNLKKLSDNIPAQNIGISFVIIPSTSSVIYKNFTHILNLGISNNINFEIIQDFEEWRKDSRLNFTNNFKKIIKKILHEIDYNNFIFINPINWELAKGLLTQRLFTYCPFNYLLEVYPSGDTAFSPFLLNREDKDHFTIGNISHDFQKKYQRCRFNKKTKKCLACQDNYLKPIHSIDKTHLVRKYYHSASLEAAKIINNKNKKYVTYAKKYLCY